jgi:hypothetical protein
MVRGEAYGPYDLAQMHAYMTENRVLPSSLVSQNIPGEWREARSFEVLIGAVRPASFRAAAKTGGEAANVFVHAEINSGAYGAFVLALRGLGAVCELTPTMWLVRTTHSSGVIRNTLSQTLERGDRFIAIDATRDRFAWFNLGPEVDVKIKDVWNAPIAAAKAATR